MLTRWPYPPHPHHQLTPPAVEPQQELAAAPFNTKFDTKWLCCGKWFDQFGSGWLGLQLVSQASLEHAPTWRITKEFLDAALSLFALPSNTCRGYVAVFLHYLSTTPCKHKRIAAMPLKWEPELLYQLCPFIRMISQPWSSLLSIPYPMLWVQCPGWNQVISSSILACQSVVANLL